MKKYSFLKRNSLSIVLLSFMLLCWAGQLFTGFNTVNEELHEKGQPAMDLIAYLSSGHFIQATFENWESEFLQMMLYILLTVSLRQKGSSESKSLEGVEDVDRDPIPHKNAPWPVKKGGIILKLYENSLSIAFGVLFIVSFILHFYGSLKDFNAQQLMDEKSAVSWHTYLFNSRFWFESLQNWQSEFLAVASIVILSIWLRQKGSPESKPIDMPHDENP
ncbi:DUF6766 family protein [Chryseobacterium wangxinyae]|uniref:DUF6766 family protein n=1 Tax=Chryseobacterium sp. CY353 TaxID=2997334 RepID=UPI00226F93BC|nr:DUF6766 family protein [Chryseobacterium sp. CY353]MCY0970834.1 hypothetical protein [Chryseobacterium sp. CY353]